MSFDAGRGAFETVSEIQTADALGAGVGVCALKKERTAEGGALGRFKNDIAGLRETGRFNVDGGDLIEGDKVYIAHGFDLHTALIGDQNRAKAAKLKPHREDLLYFK